ncbi:MAG TPA: hypothetical protein VGH52_07015 [Gaiellaceae bacterium]|jgi:hypothetical protein
MALTDDLERIAQVAATHGPVEAVLAAEPSRGARVYLVALGGEERRWLVLDDAGGPVDDRALVRGAASIVAMSEVVGELAEDDPPRLASVEYLDEKGDPSFADAIRSATSAVDEFVQDVERGYLIPLS